MRYLIFLLLLAGCTLPQAFGGGPEGVPTEQTDAWVEAISMILGTIFGAPGAIGTLALSTIYTGLKAYNTTKKTNKIVAAVDAGFTAIPEDTMKMMKKKIQDNMDEDTQKLVKKIKESL